MDKKPIGALILHGFTGTPAHVKTLAGPLEQLGLPCYLPLLSGHGASSAEALRGVNWQDWLKDCEVALFELLNQAHKAIVIGHSMGGWLALNLAADHEDMVDSIVLAGASTRTASPFGPGRPLHFLVPLLMASVKKWDLKPQFTDPKLAHQAEAYGWAPKEAMDTLLDLCKVTAERLTEVRTPALILHSVVDSLNSPQGAKMMYSRLSTPYDLKRLVWFEKSGHELFLDCEREAVIQTVVEFVQERLAIYQH